MEITQVKLLLIIVNFVPCVPSKKDLPEPLLLNLDH